MPTRINPANAAVSAVEQAAALYRVPSFRMQSRTIEVVGAGGRKRPMFMGQWTDELGEVHRKGMADLLLTPRVNLARVLKQAGGVLLGNFWIPVPLWVECKSGSGELEPEQQLFRNYVIACGSFYLEAHDCADVVIQWFDEHGVTR
jgi:hypothetical protein